MFEILRIKLFGTQPAAKITDTLLERLIKRDFGNQANEVKQKLSQVTSDTPKGKNRISAAIIRLADKDINSIDYYIDMSKTDFRDVILEAEYPRCSEVVFSNMKEQNKKRIYLDDWTEYLNWLDK